MILLSNTPIDDSTCENNEDLPLHDLLIETTSTNDILSMIFTYPSRCLQKDCNGHYATHVAASFRPSIEILQAILDIFPYSIQIPTNEGNLPLHLALFTGNSSFETICYLIKSYPNALYHKNAKGCLPIHLAMVPGKRIDENVIRLLIHLYPKGCSEKNINGNLPLHGAILYDASYDVILMLISVYPASCRTQDKYGWLPLHVAASKQKQNFVVALLLFYYCSACRIRDSQGFRPMDRSKRSHSYSVTLIVLMLSQIICIFYQIKNSLLSIVHK